MIWDALLHLRHLHRIARYDTGLLSTLLLDVLMPSRLHLWISHGTRCQCLGKCIEPWGFIQYSQRSLENDLAREIDISPLWWASSGYTKGSIRLNEDVYSMLFEMSYGNKASASGEQVMQRAYSRTEPFWSSSELLVYLMTSKEMPHTTVYSAVSCPRPSLSKWQA